MPKPKSRKENPIKELLSQIKNSGPEDEDIYSPLLKKYGLDWTVEKRPLHMPEDKPTDFFGIVRNDLDLCFATCKQGYEPFQNHKMATLLFKVSGELGLDFVNANSFQRGAKAYMQINSPNYIKSIGVDEQKVKGYLSIINSHDGSLSLKWGEASTWGNYFFSPKFTNIRTTIRHTASMGAKVKQSIIEIKKLIEAEKSMFDKFVSLTGIHVKPHHIIKIVKELTGVDTLTSKTVMDANSSTISINKAEKLIACINDEMAVKGNTMWGMFSGVIKYTNEETRVPKRKNGRQESLLIGTNNKVNAKAFSAITKYE